jgi:hypothetical protein
VKDAEIERRRGAFDRADGGTDSVQPEVFNAKSLWAGEGEGEEGEGESEDAKSARALGRRSRGRGNGFGTARG